MKAKTIMVVLFFLLLNFEVSRGSYALPAMAEVPIDRLVANLEQEATAGTNQVQQNYWIAHVHSLACGIQLGSQTHPEGFPWNPNGIRLRDWQPTTHLRLSCSQSS